MPREIFKIYDGIIDGRSHIFDYRYSGGLASPDSRAYAF